MNTKIKYVCATKAQMNSKTNLPIGTLMYTYDTQEIFMNTGRTWVKVYQNQTMTYSRQLRPYICQQCGAPLRSNVCEYCDTVYA